MDLDVVAPIYPGHCPLHLASSLQRPGKGKFPSPDPQGRFGSSLQHGQFLWVLLLHKACCFAHSGSSSTCWKAWLGRVDPLRQRAAGFSGCMSVFPSTAGGSTKVGMGPSYHHHVLPLIPSICRLHQTGEKSRLHGCICSSKFLVAGDYCVKVRTTPGDALGSFEWFCGCLPPPTLKGIVMVQDKTG